MFSKLFRSTTKPTIRKARLACESLEERRVYAINVDPTFIDFNLTATVEHTVQEPGVSQGLDQIRVDGSDLDDTVNILSFNAQTGTAKIQLQVRNNGVLVSDQTVTLQSNHLYVQHQIAIFGKRGNDTVINNTGAAIYADGGSGDDYLSGGSAGDSLNGSDGRDTIMGRKGFDYLEGDGGADYIRGGDGGDFIYGNDGDDILYGEGGNDFVYGGADNDLMFGDAEDVLQGGNDLMDGGAGNDTMWGSGGSDNMYGGDGNDWMDGGSGRDGMYGNLGSDSLYGGRGADYLDGGTDDPDFSGDLLEGGRGADTFVHHHHVFGNDDADVFTDFDPSHGDKEDDQYHSPF
ncbi:MAG TPA: calcium-binding protein [Gemmataceae bacterium]|jgi:Ca2+-binding RTX toxin-like protein|nr:calcium-binding protein [Gemmataceae bacterium]